MLLATNGLDVLDTLIICFTPVVAVAVKALFDNRRFKRIDNKIADVHEEVKSPNGSKTGESVDDIKRTLAQFRESIREEVNDSLTAFEDKMLGELEEQRKEMAVVATAVGRKLRERGKTQGE